MGEDKARFVMTNIEAMEIVVNVSLDGKLSPNTLTTSHMGRIYQWFLCPEGSRKGGPTKNMFKIRPRGKYSRQRFPYIPFVSRRFRHHKKEQVHKEATSERTDNFFMAVVRSMKEKARKKGKGDEGRKKSRTAEINEWKMAKMRLKEKRQKLLSGKDREDSFFYDVSPSLSSLSSLSEHSEETAEDGEQKKTKSRIPNVERWSNLCEEMRKRKDIPINFANHSLSVDKEDTVGSAVLGYQDRKLLPDRTPEKPNEVRKDTNDAVFSEDRSSYFSCHQYLTTRFNKMKPSNEELECTESLYPSIKDSPLKIERSRTNIRLHPKRSTRRLESFSSDVVTLAEAEIRTLHRKRKSVTFLMNLANRMNHMKQDAPAEPICECNPWKNQSKKVESDRHSSKNPFRNPEEERVKTDRYLVNDTHEHRDKNFVNNPLFSNTNERVVPYGSLRDNTMRYASRPVGTNSFMLTGNGIQRHTDSSKIYSSHRVHSLSDGRSNTFKPKFPLLKGTGHFQVERPTMNDGSAVGYTQESRKWKTFDNSPYDATSPQGTNISVANHFPKNPDDISFPAQSIGVLTRGSENGRTVETFLFNPCWPSADRECQSRSPKSFHRAIPIKSFVEIHTPSGKSYQYKSLNDSQLNSCFPRGVMWKSPEKHKSVDIGRPHRQSPVIAKCFARIHSNKSSKNGRVATVYDHCINSAKSEDVLKRGGTVYAKKNRKRGLVITEKSFVYPHRPS